MSTIISTEAPIRAMVEYEERWVARCRQIPALRFPESWEVTIMPPFGGAMVRFAARVKHAGVSVYLDFDDALDCVGEPYWEIYPNAAEETARFLLNETEEMMQAIKESLAAQLAKEAE